MNILLFGGTGMVGDGVLRWLVPSLVPPRALKTVIGRRALRKVR
jgi:hypothetical protein